MSPLAGLEISRAYCRGCRTPGLEEHVQLACPQSQCRGSRLNTAGALASLPGLPPEYLPVPGILLHPLLLPSKAEATTANG